MKAERIAVYNYVFDKLAEAIEKQCHTIGALSGNGSKWAHTEYDRIVWPIIKYMKDNLSDLEPSEFVNDINVVNRHGLYELTKTYYSQETTRSKNHDK